MSSGRSHPYLMLFRLSMEHMGPLVPTAPLRCRCDCCAGFPTDTYDVSIDYSTPRAPRQLLLTYLHLSRVRAPGEIGD
jgi:hypothetical protein